VWCNGPRADQYGTVALALVSVAEPLRSAVANALKLKLNLSDKADKAKVAGDDQGMARPWIAGRGQAEG
jgi:hypothetical protein